MQSKSQRSFISSRAAILRGKLNFHHIAIAGPLEAGKTELAARLAVRLNATVVNDETTENPFLEDFYAGTPGAAFQTQLFSLSQLSSIK